MKVLTYNVHGWQTPNGQPNLALLVDVIDESGADLVGLNEVFHPSPMPEGTALSVLAQRLGMSFAFGPTLCAVSQPEHLPYGNALLSRWPILAFAGHHLPPLTTHGQRGLLEVRVMSPEGRPLSVYVTHLDHRSESVRMEQWAAARTWLMRDRDRFHLLIGDFNALAPSDYAAPGALVQLTATHAQRGWPSPAFDLVTQVLRSGYTDVQGHVGGDAAGTYPALTPERRIDYVFLPQEWASSIISCRRIKNSAALAASDHLPVLAELA